jgi:hypothetical protein
MTHESSAGVRADRPLQIGMTATVFDLRSLLLDEAMAAKIDRFFNPSFE